MRVLASPVVADGYVVTVDMEGDGARAAGGGRAAVWRGAAVAGAGDAGGGARARLRPDGRNKLVALRLTDGKALWTHDIGGMTLSSPTPVNTDLVVAAGFPAKTIVRLSGATGEVIWQSPAVMEQFSNTSPAVGAGLVVVGSNGGRYYAFDVATGALRWEHVADGIVHLAAPMIAGGRVYMAGGEDSDRVHAVEAATGQAVPGGRSRCRCQRSISPGPAGEPARGVVVRGGGRPGGHADPPRRRPGHQRRRRADKYLSRELVGVDPTSGRRLAALVGRLRGPSRTTCRSTSSVRRPPGTRATGDRR